jgi:hypothetical protein
MSSSLPDQSRQMYSAQQSQYHIQANTFPCQQELNNSQTKVSYKLGRSTGDEAERETKESEDRLNQTSTSSRYTALLEEQRKDQHHKANKENTPKPPPI